MVGLFGATELQVTRLCRELLEEGDVFLDIGANHGAVGLNCLDRVGKTGEVHFFEPQQCLAAKIREATRGMPNTEVHQMALGAEDGVADLSVPERHSGGGSILSGRNAPGASEKVSVREAHSFLNGVTGSRPCGAKIDVEGAEADVIPGVLSLPGLKFALFEHNQGSAESIYEAAAASELLLFGLPHRWFRPFPVPIGIARDMADYEDFLLIHPDVAARKRIGD